MSTSVQQVKSVTTALAIAISVIVSGNTRAATLDIADVPLFLQTGVQPNLIMALDDSGSMDYEVQLPTNDGAAWFRRGNTGGCGSTDVNKFTGCIANSNGDDDIASATKLNFNNDGGNNDGIWEKYTSLFPNGYVAASASTFRKRLASNAGPNYYALPPIPSLAWTRSHEFNGAYFDPKGTYKLWTNNGAYVFLDSSFTSARFDPVFSSASDVWDLSKDVANTTQPLTTAACTDSGLATTTHDPEWTFRVYTGMVIPAGACVRINTTGSTYSWETIRSTITCTVGSPCDTNDEGTNRSRTIANGSFLAIRYYPATFYTTSAAELPAGFGYTAVPLTGGKTPEGNSMLGYEIKLANFGTPAQYAAAAKNFANWFTYYRKRHQALRAGLGESFRDITGLRVGAFRINDTPDSALPTSPDVAVVDIGAGTNRQTLFTQFYQDSTGFSVTPNRRAVANVIRNYKRTNAGVVH